MTGHLSKLSSPNFSFAACVGVDPELFYAEDCINPDQEKIEEARQVCLGCVEQIECLSWGMRNESFGMWGGMTSNERRYYKRKKMHKLKHLKELGII
jgi:WhiB family redox-sensing transcriptional regulator